LKNEHKNERKSLKTKEKMTYTTVWKSDFEIFKGLHPAVMNMSCGGNVRKYKNFLEVDNWPGHRSDRTPNDLAEYFEKDDFYSYVIDMVRNEYFGAAPEIQVRIAKDMMDNLDMPSDRLFHHLQNMLCWHEHHVNRLFFHEYCYY
jgi:hypothetical protein